MRVLAAGPAALVVAASLVFAGAARAQPGPAPAPTALPGADAAAASMARAEVDAALRVVEAAVVAGDIDAYLAAVDPSDKVFFKEQQNWAADFKLHVPAEFSLAILDEREPTFTADTADFEMKITWRMGEELDNVERDLAIPVRFAKLDTADGPRWLYQGERWETLVSDHPPGARVRYFAGYEDTAEVIADIMPEVREHVDEGFEHVIARAQEVKIYPSMRHLQQSIYLSYVDGLAGWNEPDESIKILAPRRPSADRLKPLLAHEYGHVATFEMGPESNDMPWWVLEGVAELSSETFSARGRDASGFMERAMRRGGPVDWSLLADFRTVLPQHQGFVYKQGQHMIAYISERFGREGRNAWLRAMAGGKTLDEATREALGMPFEQLDAEWREALPVPEPEETAEAEQPEPAPKGD